MIKKNLKSFGGGRGGKDDVKVHECKQHRIHKVADTV